MTTDETEFCEAAARRAAVVSKRSLSTTMASFGSAQAVIAAVLDRAHPKMLANVLGQGRLGLNFVVGNLAPFLSCIRRRRADRQP